MARYEIRLSGAGGQGMILAGIILAEAALQEEGLNATQTQSYGPESRGGASRAEVILSRDIIDYPKVIKPDCLLSLTQEAFDKYGSEIRDDGVIIVDERIDTSAVTEDIQDNICSLPIMKTAIEDVGMRLTANIVVLGVIDKFVKEISSEYIKDAISDRVPQETVEKNMKAFELGQKLSNELV
jgi:2-oxoglutarate ferredoxin oxidoreductase subunit gamma